MQVDKTQESIEDLQYKGLKVIQNKALFCFGMDAVLLADYVNLKRGDRVLDLCTGSGIVPILLSGREKASEIVGIELMDYVADMGVRSVALNNLQDTVKTVNGDLKHAHRLAKGVFDVVTVNPPYEKVNEARHSDNAYRVAAKHEVHAKFADICKVSNRMLKCGGKLVLIHCVGRLAELICTLTAHKLQPKRMRFIYPKAGQKPNMVLIEAMKDGGEGMVVDVPLYVRKSGGDYTDEINRIYHRNEDA